MSRLQALQRWVVEVEANLRLHLVRRVVLTLFSIGVVLLVSACADDTGNRQFATDPRTPKPTEQAVSVSPVAVAPDADRPPKASPETMVDRRGAPQAAYVLLEGRLWSFGQDGQQLVAEGSIVAYAASPSGHRVAVVTPGADGSDMTYDIAVHSADGEIDQRYDGVLTVTPASATPEGDVASDEDVYLSWAPQGRHLLLAHPSGRLIDVSLDGDVREIDTRTSLAGIAQADWSPRDDSIGVVIMNQAGNGQLGLIDPAEEQAKVNIIAPVGDGSGTERSVEAFAWRVNGDGVIFLEGTHSEDGFTDGRIVNWDQESNSTRVVATGGQAGPSGSVMSFSLAPDGKALAYSVWLPTADDWSFNGLYVRSLVYGEVYRVPLDYSATVLETRWMTDGLALVQVEGPIAEASSIDVQMIDGRGERHQLGVVAISAPGTPAASPVAAAGASPVVPAGTPGATPAATPVGTPIAATPAD